MSQPADSKDVWARRLGMTVDEPWKKRILGAFMADLENHCGEVPEPRTLPPLLSDQQRETCPRICLVVRRLLSWVSEWPTRRNALIL